MADADAPKTDTKTTEPTEHTVTSGPPRPGRSVSFTIPTFTMPRISWRNVAARTKALGVAAILLVGIAGGFIGSAIENHTSSGLLTGSVSDQKKVVTSESQLVSNIAKTVGPSVVSVNVSVSDQSQTTDGFFGFSQPDEEEDAGTGIIISSDGYVLTNRHVVPDGTTSVSVTLSNGTELKNVKVVGRTSDNDSLDIAILKITDTEGQKLSPATLGDSSSVGVGDEVVAIGNALGQFQNTVTSGIISGYGRSITASSDDGGSDSSYYGQSSSSSDSENLEDLFQTDAAINEGNSGGPLVNLNGQVIGINTAIASDSQNIGFAIPINDVKGLVENTLKTGKFERPYLGVRYIPLTADVAQQYNLSTDNGAYIAPAADSSTPSVISGSPADSAGLKEGDIITKVDGTAIDQNHSLTSLLDQHQPGDKITLTVINGKDSRTVKVTLGTAPSGS